VIKRSLYLDTTIPSYYYDQRKELDIRYRRKITKAWWNDEKDFFDLYISELVLVELQRGNYPQKEKVVRLVKDISILPIVSEIEDIVREYLKNYLMPRIDMGDAFHLAYASFYKIDYLLTWNCNHLANVNKKEHIEAINRKLKLFVPEIITPLQLFKETGDENER
jgi:predicted nucleic acid-binding protein